MSADVLSQPVLPGAKVVLRAWTPGDVDTVYEACQDPDIQRWTTVPSPYRREDAAAFVSEMVPAAWRDGGAVYAVTDPATDEVLGCMGAHSYKDAVAHVGYWTRAEARGRGFTSDALRTLTCWFFEERGAARVELVVEPANTASLRVAEAAGFRREGVLRQRLVLRGRHVDVVICSILPGELPAY